MSVRWNELRKDRRVCEYATRATEPDSIDGCNHERGVRHPATHVSSGRASKEYWYTVAGLCTDWNEIVRERSLENSPKH